MVKTVTIMLSVFFALAGIALAKTTLDDGFAAYRAGDVDTAWEIFLVAADNGSARAKRQLGKIVLANEAPMQSAMDPFVGVEFLKAAALAGDNLALIELEDLRRKGLAHSPSISDMIDIEKARASAGDPVAAWRLAGRFKTGDGVRMSATEEVRWLEIAAIASPDDFPKSGDAALRLCQLQLQEANDPKGALHWCQAASERGNPAARLILRRLASVAG